MKNENGEIVVYIGQPWYDPDGTLMRKEGKNLIIKGPGGVRKIPAQGFFVHPTISYQQYLEWKESSKGPLPEPSPQEDLDRFEMMEFD